MLNQDNTDKLNLIYAALPWLAVSGTVYATAAIAASRNITVSTVLLVAAILCSLAAFSRIQIDDSESSQSAYQFVAEVEAYLATDTQLYLNSDKLLQYYYYSSETPQIRSLENWQKSGERQENTFFIVRRDILKKNGWQGETVMAQTLESEDKAMLLFRPAAAQ
jgi:hypothetical protein